MVNVKEVLPELSVDRAGKKNAVSLKFLRTCILLFPEIPAGDGRFGLIVRIESETGSSFLSETATPATFPASAFLTPATVISCAFSACGIAMAALSARANLSLL